MNDEEHRNPHYYQVLRRGAGTPDTSPLLRAISLEQQQINNPQQSPTPVSENLPHGDGLALPPSNSPLVGMTAPPPFGPEVIEGGDSEGSEFSQSPPNPADPNLLGDLEEFVFPYSNARSLP